VRDEIIAPVKASWPTANNVSLELANDLCSEAIRASDLHDECINTAPFVSSCVADIQVAYKIFDLTVLFCIFITFWDQSTAAVINNNNNNK